jgi:hypothetical protein
VTDVQSILIGALDDDRPAVMEATGRVLAVLDTQEAQQALAERALNIENQSLKIALLGNLAESANAFGNKLKRSQNSRITSLVRKSQGELSVAAAEAHGALQLPTSNAVQLIVGSNGDSQSGNN